MLRHLPFTFLFFISIIPLLSARAQGDSDASISEEDPFYPAIIKLTEEDDPEETIRDLEESGVQILRRRANLLLTFIPRALPTRSAEIKDIRGVEVIKPSEPVSPAMDCAREWLGASAIHSGNGLDAPYTGENVVVGICDIGIDPLHIAFLDDNGKSRIKRITQYREREGKRLVIEGDEAYRRWQTDTEDEWHATHVLNILAGSRYPYAGMAPKAEIVVSTSQLSDVGLLCGAEDILDYAREKGLPAVINMSMANYLGPHDGSSLFSQYLDMIGEEAIVVLSAGNAGNTAATHSFTFTPSQTHTGMAVYNADWKQFHPYGAIEIWSADEQTFNIRIGILDADELIPFYIYPWLSLKDGERYTIASEADIIPPALSSSTTLDAKFRDIFTGWLTLYGNLDTESGRYFVRLEIDALTEILSSHGGWARYVPMIEVEGISGVHVDFYADFSRLNFRSLPGGREPSSAFSFSDLATGQKTVSVGMYTNRQTRPTLSGEVITERNTAGEVSPYSSYATLTDGRVMPHTVAPGASVISAISNPFLAAHPDAETLNARSAKGKREYFWACNTGTSMSAPYTAGTIACWLEANPYLKIDDIFHILAHTNYQDFPDAANPRNGQGWLDPYEGMKEAVRLRSGMKDIDSTLSHATPRLSRTSEGITVWNPAGSNISVEISDITGKKLATFSGSQSVFNISLSLFEKGIYIAKIAGSDVSLKFMIT
ncbi:MAG: S8 family peptidase [Muribaculaceae bacterium]|nr:S8 family peptidase [Muribaculaceae bacterium]